MTRSYKANLRHGDWFVTDTDCLRNRFAYRWGWADLPPPEIHGILWDMVNKWAVYMSRLSLLELHSGGEATSDQCRPVSLGIFSATVT